MSVMKLTANPRVGLYRHDKSGNEYLVCGLSVDSSSATELRGQTMVLYRRREWAQDCTLYVRPVSEFNAGFTLLSPAIPVVNRCTCGEPA